MRSHLCTSPREVQKSSGGLSWEAGPSGGISLTPARALTGGDLAHRILGSILGQPLPFGRAVVTGIGAGCDARELPCRESTTMPSSHREAESIQNTSFCFKGSP